MGLRFEGICTLLQVFVVADSLSFYRDVLGFEPVDYAATGDEWDWVLLKRDGLQLMLNTAFETGARPEKPDPDRVAAHGDTELYLSCPDVDGAYEYLSGRGIDLDPPRTAPYGMRQLYMRDPDGYTVCLQWPAER